MRRHFTGQIQEPGQQPKNADLILLERKEEYDSVTVTTTAYTVLAKTFIFVDDDTAAGVVTITLPPAISNTDKQVVVKKLGTTANVIVDGNASETIDGATTNTMTTQYDSLHLVCDGAKWHIL